MKEATGELNMTVVTVVAIAALMAFFYLVIWPTIKVSLALTTACNTAGQSGTYTQANDDGSSVSCGGGSCTYTPANNGSPTTKSCNDKAGY